MTTPENADELGEEASVAYQSFLDMGDSKQRHLDQLKALSVKYEQGGAPSEQENAELARLLDIHNKNVIAFKTAMAAVTDEAQRRNLVVLMS